MYLIKSKSQGEDRLHRNTYHMEFLLNSTEEVGQLPLSEDNYKGLGYPAEGSMAVVAGSTEIYVLTSAGWTLF